MKSTSRTRVIEKVTAITANAVERALKTYATPERAKTNAWFFKTGPGEYGEGDRFMGVTVPDTRKVAKRFRDLPLDEVTKLLASPVHEVRLAGLLILVNRYACPQARSVQKKAPQSIDFASPQAKQPRRRTQHSDVFMQEFRKARHDIVRSYLAHLDRVNNWDLVDLSASQILGVHYLAEGGEHALYALAKSKTLWRRRIAIVATYTFIRADRFEHTLSIAALLLNDTEDLMHKATGWMLREVGKRDKAALEGFLHEYTHRMPRTMLRYAIERFPERERKMWLRMGK